jgi:hypothetical protein
MSKDTQDKNIRKLATLSSFTLQGLVEAFNNRADGDNPIYREDIVGIYERNEAFILVYFT